jgi:hypothetical protein
MKLARENQDRSGDSLVWTVAGGFCTFSSAVRKAQPLEANYFEETNFFTCGVRKIDRSKKTNI